MDLHSIQKKVLPLVKETGLFLKKECANFDTKNIEHKGKNDLVSYVDKQAEKQLVVGLSKIFPEAGFIAEEGTGEPKENGYNWIIDPLDGTTNFIHGLPFYAVSVALAGPQNELLLGVVYEPNADECFHAIKGGAAYCNDDKIQVSENSKLADSLVATGFPYYDFGKMPQYLNCLSEFMQESHGVRRFGSAALDLAYVACGRFEAFFEYNLNAWDVAAGVLIVRQAGGTATTFNNEDDCVFGRELMASGHVHDEALDIVNKHFIKAESLL